MWGVAIRLQDRMGQKVVCLLFIQLFAQQYFTVCQLLRWSVPISEDFSPSTPHHFIFYYSPSQTLCTSQM